MKEKVDPFKVDLFMSQRMWQELQYIVRFASPMEISGLGLVEMTGEGPVVSSLHLLKQRNTGASTVMDTAALAEFLLKCPSPEKLKLWWHSHGKGTCFWSGMDKDTIQLLRGVGEWLFSVVTNDAGEYLARLDMARPIPITAGPVRLVTEEPLSLARAQELVLMVREAVILPEPSETQRELATKQFAKILEVEASERDKDLLDEIQQKEKESEG